MVCFILIWHGHGHDVIAFASCMRGYCICIMHESQLKFQSVTDLHAGDLKPKLMIKTTYSFVYFGWNKTLLPIECIQKQNLIGCRYKMSLEAEFYGHTYIWKQNFVVCMIYVIVMWNYITEMYSYVILHVFT